VTTANPQLRTFEAASRFFLGPLRLLLDDPTVSEIMVNGPEQVYVERAGRVEKTAVRFDNETSLLAAARNLAQFIGRTVDASRPLLDGRLADGSRVCVVLAPIAGPGTSINIRRFSQSARLPQFLLENQAITPEAMEFILLAVRGNQSVLVSGGTGSGKTTLLNILSTAFRPDERIVVIEDTRELAVQAEHVVQLEARPPDRFGRGEISIRDLFVSSLRMRPDRIIVGEVRRGEALDMIQAMTSGHRGCMATLHANTPADACRRLETMAMMADSGLPLPAIRRQVSSAIDLIVQGARLHSGRRLITHIAEVDFDEPGNVYLVEDIFRLKFEGETPALTWTGRRPRLADEIDALGLRDGIRWSSRLFSPNK
jgi:pilus assembly protein CpaF